MKTTLLAMVAVAGGTLNVAVLAQQAYAPGGDYPGAPGFGEMPPAGWGYGYGVPTDYYAPPGYGYGQADGYGAPAWGGGGYAPEAYPGGFAPPREAMPYGDAAPYPYHGMPGRGPAGGYPEAYYGTLPGGYGYGDPAMPGTDMGERFFGSAPEQWPGEPRGGLPAAAMGGYGAPTGPYPPAGWRGYRDEFVPPPPPDYGRPVERGAGAPYARPEGAPGEPGGMPQPWLSTEPEGMPSAPPPAGVRPSTMPATPPEAAPEAAANEPPVPVFIPEEALKKAEEEVEKTMQNKEDKGASSSDEATVETPAEVSSSGAEAAAEQVREPVSATD